MFSADHYIVLIIVTFFAGFSVHALIGGTDTDKLIEIVLTSVATVCSAFFGAKYAFSLQAVEKERERNDQRAAAGNKAVFLLLRMYQRVSNIKNQLIDPYRNNPAALITMLPHGDPIRDDLNLDLDSLTFLLETSEREVMNQLQLCQVKYQTAIDAINLRSQIHLDEVQPTMAAAGVTRGSAITLEQVKKILGERVFVSIDLATKSVFESFDSAISEIENSANALNQALKKTLPGHTIIKFVPIEKSEARQN